jgi:hypothetical protein
MYLPLLAEESAMTRARFAGEIASLFSGGGALLAGLHWLATTPLRAVLIILAAMGLLLSSVAKLCGAQVRR